jgi:mannosyltransferase OCH1-like enzyme
LTEGKGREVMLTATDENEYRTTRFIITGCKTWEEADEEIRKAIAMHPELKKIRGNQKIIDNTLGE